MIEGYPGYLEICPLPSRQTSNFRLCYCAGRKAADNSAECVSQPKSRGSHDRLIPLDPILQRKSMSKSAAAQSLGVGLAQQSAPTANTASQTSVDTAVAVKLPPLADDSAQQRYRIVHLSDLHFGANFDIGLWNSVTEQLKGAIRPDVIVVTGDVVDSPSLFGLALARNQLLDLAKAIGCPIYVVPGNHDMGIVGNVALWPFRCRFDIVFSGKYDALFAKVGDFSCHSAKRLWPRGLRRMGWAMWFLLLRLLRRIKPHAGSSCGVIRSDPVKPALIARFNSNDQMWLATGKIRESEILALEGEISSLRRAGDPRWLCPRIALVHHHVLPIPHSTTSESLTSFEPFMTLRNAGTLAFELSNLHFDLVLHGHKHYWNAARLTLDSPGCDGSELAVVAAGSATVRHRTVGRNSFNVIDVNPNGSIVHQPVFFGSGGTFAGTLASHPTQQRLLFSLDTLKRRARLKAMERAECLADVIERDIVIDEDGGGDYRLTVRGFRVFGAKRTRQQRLIVALETGAINPKSVLLGPLSSRQGHTLMLDRNGKPAAQLVIPIDLGRDLFEEQSGISYDASVRAVNTFAISEWEASQLSALGPDDTVGIIVRQPANRLRLRVEFPKTLTDLEPRLVVERLPEYPLLALDTSGELGWSASKAHWVLDQDMTTHEQSRLHKVAERIWEFEIVDPMLGFRYQLCWKVKTTPSTVPPEVRGRTQQLRSELLRLCGAAPSGPVPTLGERGQQALEDAFAAYIQPTFQSPLKRDERLGASLYVYDETEKALRCVSEHGTPDFVRDRCPRVPFNEGVVGTAFKKCQPQLYVVPEVDGDQRGYVYYPGDTLPTGDDLYTLMVALPVYVAIPGAKTISPEQMIGVFTVASNARDSNLIQLYKGSFQTSPPAGDDKADRTGSTLWKLAQRYVAGLATALEELRVSTE